MKDIMLSVVVLSYAIPLAFKLVDFVKEDRSGYWLASPVLSVLFLVVASILTAKGSVVFKYITCGYLMLCGLFMIPCYFAPAIEGLSMRLFLGSYGVLWIVSSIWIFLAYPDRRKTTSG
ncbi:hypothetical protein [Pseudodesulfovibrio sp.]|uniref:hypothetical protein n=1 Tax=Pseudodesulfovibrio sp. TaxID=2035812 RepID=UPI00261B9E92|nr:hypothetical protein [Pseudodesulfovibrio sp.]MDD3313790.1 hypothetical protein [Pseudodesulfovibrio sp.]